MALNIWATRVHEYSLRTNRGLTSQEAIDLFGTPVGESSASLILHYSARDGWFRREEWIEEGSLKPVRRVRYWAIEKQQKLHQVPVNQDSWFAGLKRVRSVFELGDSI